MAKLNTCKDCKNQISKQANKCPQCGAPQTKQTTKLILLLIVLVVGFSIIKTPDANRSTPTSTPVVKETKIQKEQRLVSELKSIPAQNFKENQERYAQLNKMLPSNKKYKTKLAHYDSKIKRQGKIESQFSKWDGSHYSVEKYIKNNLKDPDSYDHVKTAFADKGDHIIIETTYRAKNSFNATTTGRVLARASIDGSEVKILTN